jgi:hypothetical protein
MQCLDFFRSWMYVLAEDVFFGALIFLCVERIIIVA